MKLWGAAKPPTFALPLCRTYLPRTTCCDKLVHAGNEPMHAVRWLASPRQGKSSQREGNALFDDFIVLLVKQKYEKEKVTLCFFSFRVLFACPKRTKRTKRGMLSSFEHLLSPRGDSCEHTSPTVRQLLNHGYRFETLKRRLGFTAVPCRAMANLAVEILVRVCVRT